MAKKLFTSTKPAFGFVRALSIWSMFVGRAIRGKYIYWNSHSCFSISKFSDKREKEKDRIKNVQKG